MSESQKGRTAVVIGGSKGLGKEVARTLASKGSTVYVSGRTLESAREATDEIGLGSIPLVVDLSEPETIANALARVPSVDDLVIAAIERDANTMANYDVKAATRLIVLKLVGYTETIHALRERFTAQASVVLFGGLAFERPYPGSTTVSTVNGGVVGIVHSLSTELAPVRINAIHPGIIGDSPYWEGKDNSHVINRTPLGRLVTMDEIVHSVEFLLSNTGINGVNLHVDGGWLRKSYEREGRAMYHVTVIDDESAVTPDAFAGHSSGFRRQILVNRATGSPHMTLTVNHLSADGYVDAVLHSFETSLYVISGTLHVTTLGKTSELGPDHCIVLPLATTYTIRAVGGPVKWLQMEAPAELDDGRRQDTFFTGDTIVETAPDIPDMRDPRNRNAVRFDGDSMDLRRLSGGSDVAAPTVSPSMATALLAYSGIAVKMLIDQQMGAQLHTMFMVDYQPTAIAHPHDHPFEEAYVFVEGEVHALVDGELMVLHPGDVLWAGVGADHGFENRSAGLVRWIEVQAPAPPPRHSYRFSREWEHLAEKLTEGK